MTTDHLLSPYQPFDDDDRLVIEHAQGVTLTDVAGHSYLDAIGGMWCTNIGTGSDEMADAVAAQIRKMSYSNPFSDMTGQPALDLAAKLAELAPDHINHVFFSGGGSTAIDSAFRLIQFYQRSRGKPEKRHILSREDAYHGTTYAAISIGGKQSDHSDDFFYIDDIIHHLRSPNFYRHGRGMSEDDFADDLVTDFENKVAELGPEHVAAFFAEPVMGSGGVVPPPGNYLAHISKRCRELDILYVSDEVVTAFGRMGEWFHSETLGISPDIITSAKGLTSGYLPLGATLYSDAIHEVIAEKGHNRYFGVGYTYSGHPVSCVAALTNIAIMEREGILAHVQEVGPYFMDQLGTLSDLAIVGDVRGSFLMGCVEFVADKETGGGFAEGIDIGALVAEEAQRLGVIVRPIGNLNVMSPALIITKEEIDQIVVTLREAIVAAHARATS